MKLKIILPVVMLCLLMSWLFTVRAQAAAPPEVGGVLPDILLDAPKDAGDHSYLGLSWWSRPFKIPAIKARVVIIEIFSMYCPYCQAEAPKVNTLYEKIEADPALKGRIKVIGIGVGNSAYEVISSKSDIRSRFRSFPMRPSQSISRWVKCGPLISSASKSMATGLIASSSPSWGPLIRRMDFLKQMVQLSGLK